MVSAFLERFTHTQTVHSSVLWGVEVRLTFQGDLFFVIVPFKLLRFLPYTCISFIIKVLKETKWSFFPMRARQQYYL